VNISLTPELERLVIDKVETGMYQTASEVIREGLRLLKDRDQHLEALRLDIRAGFDAVERGDYRDYAPSNLKALAEGVKARGRKRIAGDGAKTGRR
jgi:antitoxin ParD1/3/4